MGLAWQRRPTPLEPAGVLATGPAGRRLARALVEGIDHGADVRVYAAGTSVLAFGKAAVLPWVDGATWLGRDGLLYLPTTIVPTLPTDLVARAAARRAGPDPGWLVLLPDRLLVGAAAAGLPDRRTLVAIADGAEPA